MGGINHQIWVVHYCYTHITLVLGTGILIQKSRFSPVSLIKIEEPRLRDVRKIQSTWQAFAALRPLGLRMLGGIGDLVKWSRNLEYVRAY